MKKIKKALRLVFLAVFILLAASGMGFGFLLSGSREGYMDKEIRTEQVDKKDDEEAENESLEIKN